MSDAIRRLHAAVAATRKGTNPSVRTEKLFRKGRAAMAKKVAEEAVEVALDAVVGDRAATVRESVDLLYNLVVLWVELGIEPDDVWAEMRRREKLLGMAEKLPKRRAGIGLPLHEGAAPLLWDASEGPGAAGGPVVPAAATRGKRA
ncbi:phosphoribosyl-ATP pyrophosphatase [Ancylobacter aquaticus]|uniref:phosphoribosyl-ATP diphosphatase n=1 Tax=Ancylobacter aquaticus TaxID=100 RepID=A0A4R1HSQ6_ANCAQ|nr:phosphoribosyl-ATP diphosphatase [Ancylobacter aquaticus]TCK23895.1 phosphoribosyl-ATP pyrophosphatase [Ancylobacter aquaticus]